MIKLIASDIDGTLVKEGSHEIDPAYFDVIRDLKAEGIRFCACSGRQFASMAELFGPVADDIFFISENGTLFRTKDKILKSWTIDPEFYCPIIRRLREIEGVGVGLEDADFCYVEAADDSRIMRLLRDEYHYAVKKVDDLTAVPSENILKITIHHPDVEKACKGLDQTPGAEHLSFTTSGAEWIDITAREAGKGEAFALLQEYLGIGIEETVYFGDNMNDLSAFHEAGVAATVANARQELHDAADIVERSYSDLGVLRELRHILDLARRVKAEADLS